MIILCEIFVSIIRHFIQRRNLGQPEKPEPLKSIDLLDSSASPGTKSLARKGSDATETKLVPRPKDGLVREINDNVKVSREERKERVETEDVHHLGDFSDKVCNFFQIYDYYLRRSLNCLN